MILGENIPIFFAQSAKPETKIFSEFFEFIPNIAKKIYEKKFFYKKKELKYNKNEKFYLFPLITSIK